MTPSLKVTAMLPRRLASRPQLQLGMSYIDVPRLRKVSILCVQDSHSSTHFTSPFFSRSMSTWMPSMPLSASTGTPRRAEQTPTLVQRSGPGEVHVDSLQTKTKYDNRSFQV
jgi:hypothetical protein